MKSILPVTCCVFALLAACSPPVEPAAAATSIVMPQTPESAGGLASEVPPRRDAQEKVGEHSEKVASWDEYISLQALSDQHFLEGLEHRYFGVVAFETAEEREYMMRAGFPSPEEWLEAKKMTDSDLQDRADAGDPKAAGMLADRMSVRLEELIALSQRNPNAVTDADRVRIATMAVAYSSRAMDGSDSPFGLYVEGMVKSSIFDSWEPMTAAMLESMNRGDPRVDRLIAELHARHPVQDIESIHVSLRGMKQQHR